MNVASLVGQIHSLNNILFHNFTLKALFMSLRAMKDSISVKNEGNEGNI